MSFSFQVTAKVGETDAAIDEAVAKDLANAETNKYVSNLVNAEAIGLIALAKKTAAGVASAVARDGDTVTISISGHANPSKEPEPGWASNMLNVSVSQVYKPTT
jgi:ribosomal protein L18